MELKVLDGVLLGDYPDSPPKISGLVVNVNPLIVAPASGGPVLIEPVVVQKIDDPLNYPNSEYLILKYGYNSVGHRMIIMWWAGKKYRVFNLVTMKVELLETTQILELSDVLKMSIMPLQANL